MTSRSQHRWLIAANPLGRALSHDDFQLDETAISAPDEGEILVQTQYLSFDPSQKSRMENLASYADPVSIGSVMPGAGLGQVVDSRSSRFKAGDVVTGPLGWQEFAVIDAEKASPVAQGSPPEEALSIFGSSGKTAYFGLFEVGRPVAGDVLVVSGAAGAVGSIVGQLGRIAGCRVIGIAGGAAKCRRLVDDLGFDAAIDYKTEKLRSRLRALAPEGVNIFFDNIGGEILNDGLARLAFEGRVVVCGGISRYGGDPRKPEQMPAGPVNYFNIVAMRARIEGFLLNHFSARYDQADRRLGEWVRDGKLKAMTDIVEGFDQAPGALMRLFEGANIGKQLLRL